MADVRIPAQRFKDKDFPSICAVTGLPAAELYAFTFQGVTGGLPLSKATVRLVRQQQITLRVVAISTVVLIAIAFAVRSGVLVFGATAMAAILLTNFSSIRARLPRATIDAKHMHLTNVHQAFVDALTNGTAPGKCAGCPNVNACEDQSDATKAEASHAH